MHGEREERQNGKVWGKEPDVKKFVDMLSNAGFQVAISHALHPARLPFRTHTGLTMREALLGIAPKRLNPVASDGKPEEATVKQVSQ